MPYASIEMMTSNSPCESDSAGMSGLRLNANPNDRRDALASGTGCDPVAGESGAAVDDSGEAHGTH